MNNSARHITLCRYFFNSFLKPLLLPAARCCYSKAHDYLFISQFNQLDTTRHFGSLLVWSVQVGVKKHHEMKQRCKEKWPKVL